MGWSSSRWWPSMVNLLIFHLDVSAWVFSELSSFLPQSTDMHIRFTGEVWLCPCPGIDQQPLLISAGTGSSNSHPQPPKCSMRPQDLQCHYEDLPLFEELLHSYMHISWFQLSCFSFKCLKHVSNKTQKMAICLCPQVCPHAPNPFPS